MKVSQGDGASGNGERPSFKLPLFVGPRRMRDRRAYLVRLVEDAPGLALVPEDIARAMGVGVKTVCKDLESGEVRAAIERSLSNNVDKETLRAAWTNIRNHVVTRKNLKTSIWLVEHTTKLANVERMFEQFQRDFAIELAKTSGMEAADFDPNQYVETAFEQPTMD